MKAVSRAAAYAFEGHVPAGQAIIRPALLKLSLVLGGIGLLTAGALCSVPFYPVPLTMQTLAVLVVGGLLGPRLGVSAVVGYLVLGTAGAPVFHGGLGGAAVLAGPTAGYLMGFIAAAALMGLAAERSRRARGHGAGRSREMALLAGGAVLAGAAIYAFGVPWLALFTDGLRGAVAAGVVPFLLGDALKTAVAIGAIRGGNKLLSRWPGLPF